VKPSELKNMTPDELKAKEISLKQELMNLRFQVRIGKLENPSRISLVRKDIARILTILKEKQK